MENQGTRGLRLHISGNPRWGSIYHGIQRGPWPLVSVFREPATRRRRLHISGDPKRDLVSGLRLRRTRDQGSRLHLSGNPKRDLVSGLRLRRTREQGEKFPIYPGTQGKGPYIRGSKDGPVFWSPSSENQRTRGRRIHISGDTREGSVYQGIQRGTWSLVSVFGDPETRERRLHIT